MRLPVDTLVPGGVGTWADIQVGRGRCRSRPSQGMDGSGTRPAVQPAPPVMPTPAGMCFPEEVAGAARAPVEVRYSRVQRGNGGCAAATGTPSAAQVSSALTCVSSRSGEDAGPSMGGCSCFWRPCSYAQAALHGGARARARSADAQGLAPHMLRHGAVGAEFRNTTQSVRNTLWTHRPSSSGRSHQRSNERMMLPTLARGVLRPGWSQQSRSMGLLPRQP